VPTIYSKPPQPTTTHYHGYAVLDDTSGNVIKSDGQGQYVDRELTKPPGYGDKIEVTFDNINKKLIYFRCFMGKPELPWRSLRRVRFNFDVLSGAEGADYLANKTVADMLTYNVVNFPTVRRGISQPDGSYYLTDNSVHLTVLKDDYPGSYQERAYFLVDKTDVAEDADAITETNLKQLDPGAPHYWTAIDASQGGSEIDPHDQIAFMLYDNGLNFTPTQYDRKGIPIMWEVTPKPGPVNLCVRRQLDDGTYNWKVLRTFGSLPFKLIVSKNPLVPKAPPKHNTLSNIWGEIKAR
jgi:hypothetical protein